MMSSLARRRIMANARARFGLTLPNRGVIIGATTVAEMLEMAEWAESAGWDSVWVGDSIFAKPRLDAMVLLGALAARTKRVRLGPACFASTPLRDALILAYQWAISCRTGARSSSHAKGSRSREAAPSTRNSLRCASNPAAGCAGWKRRSRSCA
jgi:hypothetical protein